MSWDNYQKNHERSVHLYSTYKSLEKEEIALAKSYTCHCRCCEDIYEWTGAEIIKSGVLKCKCGSWRLGVFDEGISSQI